MENEGVMTMATDAEAQ